MKCLNLFSEKNKKNISICCLLKILPRMISIKRTMVPNQGPVVQNVLSLTSLLRVILLTVLADSIYNILIFFAKKM